MQCAYKLVGVDDNDEQINASHINIEYVEFEYQNFNLTKTRLASFIANDSLEICDILSLKEILMHEHFRVVKSKGCAIQASQN